MLTFITDETIVQGKDGQPYKLSIYGGLILTEADFQELNKFLFKLKDNYILPQTLDLKWRFESVWENMKKIGHIKNENTKENNLPLYKSLRDSFNNLKGEILNKIASSQAKIVIVIRPNKLVTTSDKQMLLLSTRVLVKKFEKILEKNGEAGIILADELPKLGGANKTDYEYILRLCYPGSTRLISIVPTINSGISPLHQINDIVLGAIQYYMLEFMRKLKNKTHNTDIAKDLLGKIVKNFYKSTTNWHIINNGIIFYPLKTKRRNVIAGNFLSKLQQKLEIDFKIK